MTKKPLVVVTRDEGPRGVLREALAARGADVRVLPTLRTAPAEDPAPLHEALATIRTFHWLAFTSARGVDAVAGNRGFVDAWAGPERPRVAAVGPASAERLKGIGAPVDLVGKGPGGVDLARDLIATEERSIEDIRVLWPRSDRARFGFAEELQAAGAHVAAPIAYRTIPVHPDDFAWFATAFEAGEIDAVVFMSPSSASGLAAAFEGDLSRLATGACVASIGHSTSAALRDLGATPQVQSTRPAATTLADELMAHIETRQGVCR